MWFRHMWPYRRLCGDLSARTGTRNGTWNTEDLDYMCCGEDWHRILSQGVKRHSDEQVWKPAHQRVWYVRVHDFEPVGGVWIWWRLHLYQKQARVSLLTSSCHVNCFSACVESLDVGNLIVRSHACYISKNIFCATNIDMKVLESSRKFVNKIVW